LSIAVIIFIATPTASHAIIDAGYGANVEPWSKGKAKADAGDHKTTEKGGV
jgi:multisubunit Na+/H+ antiporter MnhG subunit